jgi:hypothetical protein
VKHDPGHMLAELSCAHRASWIEEADVTGLAGLRQHQSGPHRHPASLAAAHGRPQPDPDDRGTRTSIKIEQPERSTMLAELAEASSQNPAAGSPNGEVTDTGKPVSHREPGRRHAKRHSKKFCP